MAQTPRELGYQMPAEWEPHAGTWLSWPHSPRTWVGNFGPIPHVFVEIVRALCGTETVNINVRDRHCEEGIRVLLKDAGLDSAHVRYHPIPTNDAWARDHGPIFVTRPHDSPKERIAALNWIFNAWGGKYPPWDDDDAVPGRVAERLSMRCFHPQMVLEGGSIDINGAGTLLTTECVLLNPNRNPQLDRADIERNLRDYLGVRHIVWLKDGIVGDDTDGHIDDLARFVNPRTIVTVLEDDPSDVNYRALQENFERLQNARDQDGQPFEIIALPSPGRICRGALHAGRAADERLPASYANFYIANGVVLVPTFDSPRDAKALGILADLFPGRRIVGIRCNDLVGGYGAIHCVTQQQPAV